jgi:hypothetical protein
MPKTKRVVSKKPQAKASEPVKVAARKNACDSSCWLCWLFKLMIAMFVLMIIFWLGFCFGALSSEYPSKRAYKPMMSTLSPQNFCANPELKKDISVENAMSAMMNSLKNKTGEALDKEFLLQMTLQHQNVIEMAKIVLEKSDREDLKAFAQSIIDAQNKEIDSMKSWQAKWFSPASY